MRILLVTSMVPQAEGAGAIPILLHAQLQGLREHHEVTLVTAVGDERGEAEAAAQLVDSGFDAHFADRRQPRSATGRWRRRARLATAWLRGRHWRAVWFADPGVQAILDRLAATSDFDIAVVEDSAMSGYQLPAGVTSILTEHEVLRPRAVDWHPGPPSKWPSWVIGEIDWRRRPRFQRAAWGRFDRVLVFGRRDAETIAELAPEVAARTRVSPFGLDLPPQANPAREQAGTVLFVGNFTHQPNRDAATWLAREIMPMVLERRPEAQLRIVGSNPPPEVLALASPSVEVFPDAPNVESHLEEAAVVVAPVRTGGGMRMKVLQAIAAGKAAVTTARGAEGFDVFEPDPPLRIADSSAEIADAVSDLLDDPAQRRELGRQARAFAERHHSPSAWAKRLEAVYEEAREIPQSRPEAAGHSG